jgi:tetratricopeptide (TPR) repeat protein
MLRHRPVARRPWQAALVVSVFVVAVAGAAFAGWWYAHESSPHPGPIVLISVDGLAPNALQAADNEDVAPSSIGGLATDAVVFTRAYTHSPLTLPSVASLLSGQLPFTHGVRDIAGFSLSEDIPSLAELLRNRGFETGAAVSSFQLRHESGIAQGFTFFDADLPESPPDAAPVVERNGLETVDAVTKWLRSRQGNRFFLFLHLNDDSMEAAVAQLLTELRERELYDQATIVLTADHGPAITGLTLDEAALHVPLLVKQPHREGAGRSVTALVQHIDILPTVLDWVRAPMPSDLRGRSLRDLLDTDATPLPDQLIYAESMAGQFRFGSTSVFALSGSSRRYVRGSHERLVPLDDERADWPLAETHDEIARLSGELDRLLEGSAPAEPTPIAAADEERFAALGYLGGPPLIGATPASMAPEDEALVGAIYRSAALLVARKQYSAAIDRLRDIARAFPTLAVVQYQMGMLLSRAGRLDEAERALLGAAVIEPDNPYIQVRLANVVLRAGREEDAARRASLAVALAEHRDGRARAAAHEAAAMVALARGDSDEARRYAEAAERDDPEIPLARFVVGQAQYAEGLDEEALASFEAVANELARHRDRSLEGLQWHLGNTLARLNRNADAERAYRQELHAFPRSIRTYESLAMLYHEADQPDDVYETLEALLVAAPTPEGYDAAARLWGAIGDPTLAAALRTAAGTRFRGDPSLALFQRGR